MPFVLSAEDIADTLNIGINKTYALIKSGKIKSLKLGQHYRIPRESFIEFIKHGEKNA